MPLYEHIFLARQDISGQQVDAMIKDYTKVIEDGGGKVGKTEYWGLRALAYKIKKSRKAHYALMNIDAPPAAVAEMERRMSLSGDVIRFLSVRVEAHEAEPSVQMRKGDREERRGDREGERGGFRGGARGGGRGPSGGARSGERGAPRGERSESSTFRTRSGGSSRGGDREREGGDGQPRPQRPPRPPRGESPPRGDDSSSSESKT